MPDSLTGRLVQPNTRREGGQTVSDTRGVNSDFPRKDTAAEQQFADEFPGQGRVVHKKGPAQRGEANDYAWRTQNRQTVGAVVETLRVLPSVSGTTTMDPKVAANFDLLITGDATLEFEDKDNASIPPGPPTGPNQILYVTLVVRQDGTGGHAVSFGGTVRTEGGASPALATAANARNVVLLVSTDRGASWDLFVGGRDMK